MGEKSTQNPVLKIIDLPADLLLTIFDYLDIRSLCRVSEVCHFFNVLADSNALWEGKAKNLTMTSSEFGLSLRHCPKLKEQCRLSDRWVKGRCKIQKLLKFEKNYLPWLAFDPDQENLFLSKGDVIEEFSHKSWAESRKMFSRQSNSVAKNVMKSSTTVHKNIDVCRFFVTEKYVVTGGWHGRLSWFSVSDFIVNIKRDAHDSDISDVAVLEEFVVSGSRDERVKIWQLGTDGEEIKLQATLPMADKVLSIAINKYKRTFAVGTGGLNGVHPLRVQDLVSGRQLHLLGTDYRNGAGVLDCHFQSPDTLMSAGYDTYVRLWDTRTSNSQCVRAWEEPHDNTVYCVTSDCNYGFVSGSCRHGVARLWDTRMKNCLQTFYLGGNVSSPVYALRLTHTHLFAGLARGIFALDFR